MHRVVLVFRMPQLMIIDGIPVTDEERNKAEMYFADQFPVSSSWSFARVCNLQMVFQFSCYFSPLCMRGIKMSNVSVDGITFGGLVNLGLG